MGRAVAWAGVALGATYLIFVGGGWWGIYTSPLRLLTMVIAGVALATWMVVALRQPGWRPRTLMWPAILACLGSLGLSTLFSNQPRVSLEYLAYAIVLATLYLLLVRLFANPFFRPRLVALMVMLFGAIAVLYIASVIGGWIEWWQLAGLTIPPLRPGFAGLTYGNPSAALTMVVLLAVPVAATIGAATRRGAVALVAVGLVIGAVALISGSRAGWFALGVTFAAGIVTVAWVPSLRQAALDALRIVMRRRPAVLWPVVAVLLVGGLLVAPAIVQRAFSGGESFRLSFAVAAIRMFATSPLVGTGPGTWVIQRPGVIEPGEPDDYVPHAHNVEVQTLAELGLLGAVAGIVLLVSVVRLLRLGARSPDPVQRRWAWFAAAGLGYFFLHQLLDFYANMPAFLFAAAVPIAYLDARPQHVGTASLWRVPPLPMAAKRLGTAVGTAIVVVCVVGLSAQEIPALRHDTAVAYVDVGDWQAAVEPARDASALDPAMTPYQFTAGLVASATGDHAAAAADFERVVAQIDLPDAWLNLAAEQAALGDSTTAQASIARALRLGQVRPTIAMAAGDLSLRIGDLATAAGAFAAAIASRPSLAGDPWWSTDPARQALYREVVSSAIAGNQASAWEIELMVGLPVTSAPPAQPIAAAWNGDAAAVQVLVTQCAANPLNIDLLSWCARVLRHVGETDRAAAFTQRVALISLGAAESSLELRVTQPGATGFDLAPALWATYTYRRPSPRDTLVQSLIHLHLE